MTGIGAGLLGIGLLAGAALAAYGLFHNKATRIDPIAPEHGVQPAV